MSDDIDKRCGNVTHQEAYEILSRYNASHFRHKPDGERAKYTIPADPSRDSDLRLHAYIAQNEARIAELERSLAIRNAECAAWREWDRDHFRNMAVWKATRSTDADGGCGEVKHGE